MSWIRTLIFWAVYVVIAGTFLLLLELPVWLWDRFVWKRNGRAFVAAQRWIGTWVLRLYPFGTLHLSGLRSVKHGPVVYVCNRQSMLDWLLYSRLRGRKVWVLNASESRFPLMNELNTLARHIIVGSERDDQVKEAVECLDAGISVVFFPEKRISRSGRLQPFRDHAFEAAKQADVPIVPVVLSGTSRWMRRGQSLIGPCKASLRVLAPMPSDSPIDKVRDAMRSALEKSREKPKGWPYPVGWVSRLGMAGVALLIGAVAGLSLYVKNFCIAEPPEYTGSRALADAKMQVSGKSVRLGENWRRNRDGVWEIALTGNAWERGYANAKMNQELTKAQEDHLIKTADQFIPNAFVKWLLMQGVAVNNRDLPDYFTEDEKLEVLGLTEGSEDFHPDEAPLYHRLLNYHAAHDISHMFIDNPLVSQQDLIGCTAFAAWGDATAEGDLIVGRNFDWEAGEIFDRDKAILYVFPEGGIPYVQVAWAGMAGAVTGMNQAGLSVHLNAGRTADTGFGRIGTPVSLLVKRILSEAKTISDAEKILRDASVFVSDSFMVASRDEKRSVVFEKSPEKFAVREATRKGLLLQTNHFLGEPFADDATNQRQRDTATTQQRWDRLKEITDARYGEIDASAAVAILRDKRGVGDVDIGIGNRNAIDAGICCHSVVMNLTTGELWVARGPHTYGDYLYVNVKLALEAGPRGARFVGHSKFKYLGGDKTDGDPKDLREFRKQVRNAHTAVDAEDKAALGVAVKTMQNINRKAFETSYFNGRLLMLRGKTGDAAKAFQEALDRKPAYQQVRDHIQEWLKKAESE